MKAILPLAALLLVGAAPKPAPEIPVEYSDLYLELRTAISGFRTTINQSWDGTRAPVAFAANLLMANSGHGPDLLAPNNLDALRYELDGLKALGVKAVSLDISFPVLYRPFHQSQEEYDQYLAFYTQVAQDVRARGLKLVIESQVLLTEGGYTYWDLAPYYASLTMEEYQQGRMEVARTIAVQLQPDYLSVIQEPDTEADQTGKPELGTVEGSTAVLDAILTGLQAAGVQNVAVGAGMGTWQPDYLAFVHGFASRNIDFVDIHVFVATGDNLGRALEIADIAKSYGKSVGMTETWLYKARSTELDVLDFATIFTRDVFSFWAPLDALHLTAMVELAHFKQFEFISPFWTGYFRAYVTYDDSTKNLPPDELNLLARTNQLESTLDGVYSTSAHTYRTAIVEPTDVTRPDRPSNLVAQLASPFAAVLTWSTATDNIGTAFYRIYRDRVLMTQTAATNFSDTGLSDAQEYDYVVVAFDAAGNRSKPAPITVTTVDVTPPTVPANLAAVASLGGPQINIDVWWSPSVDNVGVAQYIVYRGTTPDALSAIGASTTNSFRVENVTPETTYWFAVAAADAIGNRSDQSPASSVVTPIVPDTTAPGVSVASPAEGSTIDGTTYLNAIAFDVPGGLYEEPSGEAAVQFRIDGLPVDVEQTVPFSETEQYSRYRVQLDTRSLPNGQHVVTAVARDVAGNVATSTGISVTVSN